MAYIEELAKALRHPDPKLRERVVNAFRELEDPRATMPLVEALGDECEDVRRAAAWALSWVGDARARDALIGALGDDCEFIRLNAASGLGRLGGESAVEALIGALSDSYSSVRYQAVSGLAEIGDRRAVGPISRVLNDEDPEVRCAARFYLKLSFGFEVNSNGELVKVDELAVIYEVEEEHLQKVLEVIKEMEDDSGAAQVDKLYEILYEKCELGREIVTPSIKRLIADGLVSEHRPGYYSSQR